MSSECVTSIPLSLGAHRCLDEIEISEWLDWMRRELPVAGLDLPSDETSVLFAARSVDLARQHHLPTAYRHEFIQASLLRQCWLRQKKLRENVKVYYPSFHKLAAYHATKYLGRWNGQCLVQATTDTRYVVEFPRSNEETALATKAVCIELARRMGLPVPSYSVILVSRDLARSAGITSGGWPRYWVTGGFFVCLGLMVTRNLVSFDKSLPTHRLDQTHTKQVTGSMVFDILALNLLQETPLFRVQHKRQVAPVFLYQSHCMMDANWSRFLRSSHKELPGISPTLSEITSTEDLNLWIDRARKVDFNRLWELAFALPAVWYGEHRVLLTAVLRKLEGRAASLRKSVHYFINNGFFPNLQSPQSFDASDE